MIKTYLFLAGPAVDPFVLRGDAAADALARACPAALGYVQSRALAEQLDAVAVPPYAGIAELWFQDAADALALAERPAALAPLWRGGEQVVAATVVGHERVVMRLPEHHERRGIKGVFPFRRRTDLSVSEFRRAWWHGHGPIAARTEGALAYVQCHPLDACYRHGAPDYDGVTELCWPDVTAARSAMSSRQMREDQASDSRRFAQPDSVRLLLVEEEVVIAP